MIPISDTVGFYTGSTVEAALMETPYKLIAPDGGINPVLSTDIAGDVTLAGTGTLFIPELLAHSGDPDTYWSLTDDQIEATVGGLSMLKLTETTQDLITLGPGSGDVDIDFNGDAFLQGSDGRFGIGTDTPTAQMEIQSTSLTARVQRSDNTGGGAGIFYRKSRGTLDTPLIVQNNDFLSGFETQGYDGSNFIAAANITMEVDGTPGVNDMPGRVTLWTTADGASSPTRRVTIKNDGKVGIGTTSPQGILHSYDAISGLLKWEYDGLDATVRTVVPNGTGDCLYRLSAMYVLRDSAAAVANGTAAVSNGASTNLTVGGNTVRLRVNADGSVDVARTAGTDTIKVNFLLIWL
jgi:hypothetical protein